MKAYLVGGAVRDQLLDLPVRERDWVVVGSTEQEMLAAGFKRADASFPVFIHPETGEEYALARTEVKSGAGYKGFEVYAGPDVTLEQDLRRRDLTINALAMDETGQLIDCCNGREDLDEGLLRHITPAFVEDPVRLLRIARFAAKLGQWGFRVAHGTHGLMKKMASSEDLLSLKPERIYREMWKALGEPQPWRFFEVLHRCGALARLMPDLASCLGRQEAHRAAAQPDPMAALQRSARLTRDPAVRFAVVFYPAVLRAQEPDRFVDGLRVGKQAKLQLQDLQALLPQLERENGAERLLQNVRRLQADRQPERLTRLIQALQALLPEQAAETERRLRMAAEVLGSTEVARLREQGLQGAELGRALRENQLERLRELMERESW
jgi:tRNA nucleotidyltransferase (CCA-adding enzyme)